MFLRGCLSALVIVASLNVKVAAPQDVIISNGRAIPEDNLAYPVLFSLQTIIGKSLASGFYINTTHGIYLVTANHFFGELDSILKDTTTKQFRPDVNVLVTSYSRDPSDNKRNSFLLNLRTLESGGHLQTDPTTDIVVITLGIGERENNQAPSPVTTVAGVTVQEMATLGTVGVSIEAVKKFDQVLIGNDVIMYGYPTSIGLSSIPQLDPDRPLLRKGIVSGKNVQKHTLVLDCPTYQGNSVGPIFEIDRELTQTKYFLIGVAEQYVPYAMGSPTINIISNSGYGIATPMDPVIKIVEQVEQAEKRKAGDLP